jgi:glucose-6-phosphate 1-dehydrogenase
MTHVIRRKSKAEPAPPTTLFLFGAHGDLVKRLLMPALYNLSATACWDGLRIVGVDHNAISDEGFAQKLEDFIRTEAAAKVGKGDQALDPACGPSSPRASATSRAISWTTALYRAGGKNRRQWHGNAVFYLATAPRFSVKWCASRRAGLLEETPKPSEGW